jgi:hypothetical protein
MGTKVAKSMRLVEWNVDVSISYSNRLSMLDKHPTCHFLRAGGEWWSTILSRGSSISNLFGVRAAMKWKYSNGQTILEEATDVIDMPRYDAKTARRLSKDSDGLVRRSWTVVPAAEKIRLAPPDGPVPDVPFHNLNTPVT